MPSSPSDLTFTYPTGSLRVLVRGAVLLHVSHHRQTSCWRREAGGQLFARIHGDEWSVEQATGPRQSDLRSRFGFRPNRKAEQQEIGERFTAGLHYVGDWHTHPESSPKPSSTDISSMKDMVSASRHELAGFLMMIVGTRPGPSGIWLSIHRANGEWSRLDQSQPTKDET
ncbi:Mov34/MPN/PAD-1 family protein [Xanthobacter autotrophicus]|uniref:Mov34/MPN/PAD-1 family protein n=1 Tax=Xanthobacter autotrophicus TaxID=280 RepID=UPI00372CE7F7